MPANQKYSTRVHSRRQIGRASEHIQSVVVVACEITDRYKDALPQVSEASKQILDMLALVENMLQGIKDAI